MKNKILLTIMIGMFLISLASVSANEVSLDSWGTGKQNTNFTINQQCASATYTTLSTIQYPDKTIELINYNMTYVGAGSFQYNFSGTSQLGRYDVCFVTDGCEIDACGYFEVTPNGKILDVATSIMSIFILGILIMFLVFSISGVNKSEKAEWQIAYICISYILLFSTFFLLWVFSKNYLFDIEILERVFWIAWLVLSILFFPFIIGISSYLLKQQAEALLEEDLVKQGYTKEEAREMSKRRKR